MKMRTMKVDIILHVLFDMISFAFSSSFVAIFLLLFRVFDALSTSILLRKESL